MNTELFQLSPIRASSAFYRRLHSCLHKDLSFSIGERFRFYSSPPVSSHRPGSHGLHRNRTAKLLAWRRLKIEHNSSSSSPPYGLFCDALFVTHSPAHQQSMYQGIPFWLLIVDQLNLFEFVRSSFSGHDGAAPSALDKSQLMVELRRKFAFVSVAASRFAGKANLAD